MSEIEPKGFSLDGNTKLLEVWFLRGRFLLVVLAFILISGLSQAVSVTVDGWKFTTELDGWKTYEGASIVPFDSSNPDWQHPCSTNEVVGTWKGTRISNPIYYPAYPNAPEGNEHYGMTSAGILAIYVVKVPVDLKKHLEDQDIAVYGSLDKVPDDRKADDLNEILTDATRIPTMCVEWDSDKNIDFASRKAHLSELDGKQLSSGTIAVSLDENTVAVIETEVKLESYMADAVTFNGRAWDVINSIAIVPA